MRKPLFYTLLLALVAGVQLAHAVDDDEDWRSKYGAARVQIKRIKAETPTEIYELKRASAKSAYDAEQRTCKYKEGSSKQYCMRAAEEKFNSAQGRLRDERDAAEAKRQH